MERLFQVWICLGKVWSPTKYLTQKEAEQHAVELKEMGYMVRVIPRLRVTVEDILDD